MLIDPFLNAAIFAVSLYALTKGADWLIRGASQLARGLQVPELIIGLTIVAFGTSLPEFVVSFRAAMNGNGELAFANVVGSNITNILLVLGCTAVILPISATKNLKKSDIFLTLTLVIFFLFSFLFDTYDYNASDNLFSLPIPTGKMNHWIGYVLLLFLIIFIYNLFSEKEKNSEAEEFSRNHLTKSVLLTIIGLLSLIIGGHYTVLSAVDLARLLGVSETFIGLSIVALGTSLPELVTSIVAARKGWADMALGNIIGSNFLNLTLVLGFTLTYSPITINEFSLFDVSIMTLVTLVLICLLLKKKKPHITKLTGIFFLMCYVIYVSFITVRQLYS